jgi:hypothetical protein
LEIRICMIRHLSLTCRDHVYFQPSPVAI